MSLIRGKLKNLKAMLRYMEKMEEEGNIKAEHGVSILKLCGSLFLSGVTVTSLTGGYFRDDLTGASIFVLVFLICFTFLFGSITAYHSHKILKGVHKDDKK